jgi:S-formylglutathione hydrolase FrmB
MALAHVHWYSQTLAKMVATSVILPDVGSGPFATFYLLHGLSDDHTAWLRRSRIEWYVRELPLIVVLPDGGRCFYTDNADGPAYGAFFAQELPDFIERTFPAHRDRAGRCIGGLSMGGYGALRLALAHPDRYASANSHSGALLAWRFDPAQTVLSLDEHRRIFGADLADGTAHDLLTLAKRARGSGYPLPRLLIDCGTEDHLLPSSRMLTAKLKELGVPHEYHEHSGAHEWDYWNEHVRDAIAFHTNEPAIRSRPVLRPEPGPKVPEH